MTVSVQTTFNTYTGNGVTTVFPYQFKVLDQADLTVYVGGVLKTLTADYTVSGVGADAGGSVTMLVAPGAADAVSIIRAMQVKRTTDYQTAGDFAASTVNPDFDRAVLLIQDVRTQLGRSIRTPADEVGTLLTLPSLAARIGKYITFDATGQPIASAGTGNDSALRTDLAVSTTGSQGARLTGYRRTATGAAAFTLQDAIDHAMPSVFDFMTAAQIADVQARTLLVDVAVAVQAAHDAFDEVYYPPGGYRIGTTITVNRGAKVRGANRVSTDLYFYGCNGFTVDVANSRAITIEGVALRSRDAVGVPDPRAFHAISLPATSSANSVSSFISHKNFFQGWDRCHDWRYVVSSIVSMVETVNCNIGVRLFGQCLNNIIDDSVIVVNGGTAAIQTAKDGAVQGEGLAVSNTILAGDLASGATRGFVSDGFLLASFSNCIADLFPGRACDLTDCKGFSYIGGWVFSKKQCFAANDQGSTQDQGWSIETYATTTDPNEDLLYWGTNNQGLSWKGGKATLTTAGTGRLGRFNGTGVYVEGVQALNATANASFFVNADDVYVGRIIGANTVEYSVSQVPVVASAAALTLPRKSRVFLISGVTNITSIVAAGWDGQVITLIFQGILTLTDGGNLKLAANFVTTADDAIQLACAAGNWYQVAPGSVN